MKLRKSVKYRAYGSLVYAVDTQSHKTYIFSETVYPLLECLQGDSDVNALCESLASKYAVENSQDLLSDVEAVLLQLNSYGLLESADSNSSNADSVIRRHCQQEHLLYSVGLELTYACNERCVHCYVADEDKRAERELTLQEYISLFDDLRDMGVMEITLTGGEIAVRRDLFPILEYATQCGFAIRLYSNAIGFSDDDLSYIASLQPRSVSCSLYSGIAEEHDRVTGVPGSFNRTLHALMYLKCAGVLVSVKTVIMKNTETGFAKLNELCHRLGIELENSYHICATNCGGLDPTKYRLGDVDSYKKRIRCAQAFVKPQPSVAEDDGGERLLCRAGRTSLSINPFGEVFPCNGYEYLLGNVRDSSIQQIWQSDKLKALYEDRFSDLGDKCGKCSFKDDCYFCPGASLAEMGDKLAVIPETCLIAQAFTEVAQEEAENTQVPVQEH